MALVADSRVTATFTLRGVSSVGQPEERTTQVEFVLDDTTPLETLDDNITAWVTNFEEISDAKVTAISVVRHYVVDPVPSIVDADLGFVGIISVYLDSFGKIGTLKVPAMKDGAVSGYFPDTSLTSVQNFLKMYMSATEVLSQNARLSDGETIRQTDYVAKTGYNRGYGRTIWNS